MIFLIITISCRDCIQHLYLCETYCSAPEANQEPLVRTPTSITGGCIMLAMAWLDVFNETMGGCSLRNSIRSGARSRLRTEGRHYRVFI